LFCPTLQQCLRVEAYALTTEIALKVGHYGITVKRSGAIVQGPSLKCGLRVWSI